jgi:hypothetical protein
VLNQEELDLLTRAVTNATSCEVQITQDEHGRLHFLCFYDQQAQSDMLASPWGSTLDGIPLWKYELDGHDSVPVGTLDAKMISGLLIN